MERNSKKFILLMRKNWLLQRRRLKQTGIEIMAPILLSTLLVVIRSLVDPEPHPAVIFTPYSAFPFNLVYPFIPADSSSNTSAGNMFLQRIKLTLLYSPRNREIDEVMSIIDKKIKTLGFNNSKDMETYYMSDGLNHTFAGIQFNDDLRYDDTLPKDLKVVLRFPSELRYEFSSSNKSPNALIDNWKTNALFPVYKVSGPRDPADNYGSVPAYYQEGFLGLQQILAYLLMAYQEGKVTNSSTANILEFAKYPAIQMQRFPHANYTSDMLLQALESFVGLIILLSFVYPCINTVRVITSEKEKQLKESMKIMGLPNWLHWLAWFVKSFCFMMISTVLIIILLKIKWYTNTKHSVFTNSDPFVMLLFMSVYLCATITFCFAVSVFFSKANTAAQIAALLWFLSFTPFMFLLKLYDQLSLTVKLVSSLGLNSAMGFGFQLMLIYEENDEGIQWNNLWKSHTPDDSLTVGLIMLMLMVDSVIYLLIALYFEAIFPGEYGVPLPWYFPVQPSFWCNSVPNTTIENLSEESSISEGTFFEKEPSDLYAGVQIKNLRKVFGNKVAVKNLYLNMYEGQITVLLGHNGAGKTTTMSMLTGMIPPTSGTAIVNGYNIRTSMPLVRSSLGLCPQHNILFDDLTVREHLYFFSKLKGLTESQCKLEINKYLELLELIPKADHPSRTLSGGMKRKLCVGMALCGNSKVVMLDEPTAGMDPSARRALWELILSQKEGRSILLTTHFMDEADLLGDRIAIMAKGELKCCGSSFALKKRYGTGYHLVIDKTPRCKTQLVTELLSKYLKDIKPDSDVASKLIYTMEEKHSHQFSNMLGDLEKNANSLGIRSYGISLTTLEEVFMKAGADNDLKDEGPRNTSRGFISDRILNKGTSHFLTGFPLIRNQILAMLLKKGLSALRSSITYILALVSAVIFLVLAILAVRASKKDKPLPPLELTLNPYKFSAVTVVEEDYESNFSRIYENYLNDAHQSMEILSNITSTYLNWTATNPVDTRYKYLVGASFEKKSIPGSFLSTSLITAWFNNDAYHTPGLALGLVLNTAYKEILGNDHSLTFVNFPFPYTYETWMKRLLTFSGMGFQIGFNIGFSMAFVSPVFIMFYISERVSKSKHLQLVSGTNVIVFWLTSFIIDLLIFFVIVMGIIITLAIFQEDGFKTADDLTRMLIILMSFAFSVLPLQYLFSYFFDMPSTGYVRMALFGIISGVTAFLVVQVLNAPDLDLEYIGKGLHWLFLIFPHYCLCSAIQDTFRTYSTYSVCNDAVNKLMEHNSTQSRDFYWHLICKKMVQCCDLDKDYFKWNPYGIGRNMFYTYFSMLVMIAILLLKEYKVFSKLGYFFMDRMGGRLPQPVPDEDSDVVNERQRIQNMPMSTILSENTLVLKDVTKYYKKFLAVNGLHLAIGNNECFGLLGINGAGKTSTFKMLTGDHKMTHGDAWVKGLSVKSDMKQVQRLISYCPQFDAVLKNLTARETITMYCLIRGITYDECSTLAEGLAVSFDFKKHLDKKVNQLSGGNKRKLSTALAVIGDPQVIYLDEPTTGMDPGTKRYLWNALCEVRDSGKCLVLTSHSMEECEALCTNVAIMVNGNFMCLGSIQHLKNKFSKGCTLTIKIRKNSGPSSVKGTNTTLIEQFIRQQFPRSALKEKHQELLTFYIEEKLPWSQMFGILEEGKNKYHIEDYSLTQTSLEQVFLSFTRLQREEVEDIS